MFLDFLDIDDMIDDEELERLYLVNEEEEEENKIVQTLVQS